MHLSHLKNIYIWVYIYIVRNYKGTFAPEVKSNHLYHMSLDYSSFNFWNGLLRLTPGVGSPPCETHRPWVKHTPQSFQKTTTSLLMSHWRLELVIFCATTPFSLPLGSEARRWLNKHSRAASRTRTAKYWMAFIKCCCSNRYLRDCSIITDNEKYRTNRVTGPYRRRSSNTSSREKLAWIKSHESMFVRKEIEWDSKREEEATDGKTERSKFGSRAPVYVTSDLKHFWEPTPSQVWITHCCVCVYVCVYG